MALLIIVFIVGMIGIFMAMGEMENKRKKDLEDKEK
jgi:hypothetical protein